MNYTTLIVALAMAIVAGLAIGAPLKDKKGKDVPLFENHAASPRDLQSSLRGVGRFLTKKEKNPRAYNCHKNPQVCRSAGSSGPVCCKNKCVDSMTDLNNCGACGVKCKFTTACCRGECVYLSFDKRHCGRCNNRCKKGDYCIYGLCNYA
ncbi:stigma-specific STIG1-like protein 1 [Cinnamomum micranthum f. kanehirae]|uniref:Stigma-specific STIG1-like protein 1 n=1 Tax=Cinnamomum micranthum f. kanehirae TaxID=337451 RepID=A0A3S3NPF9_9MAGN|nr:stigma-specific STIG1-like protein 1 [Cinnamomum micranthum f. kanehirae]